MNYEPTDVESFDNYWKDIYHKEKKLREEEKYVPTC